MNLGIFFVKFMRIIKSPFSLLNLVVVPIGATLGLGFLLEKGQQDLVIPVAFVDEDQSGFSETVKTRLQNQPKIQLYFPSRKEAERMILRKEVDSVFVIKEGFEDSLLIEKREESVEVWITSSSLAEGIVRELIASEVLRMTSNIKAAEFIVKHYKKQNKSSFELNYLWQEAFNYSDKQWEPAPLMTIDYETFRDENSVKDLGKSTYSPFLGLWTFFSLFSCFLSIGWIVGERSLIFPRIKSTYKGLFSYIAQSVGVLFIFQCIQVILSVFLLSRIKAIEINLDIIVSMILFIFIGLALSVLLASVSTREKNYYLVSSLLVLLIGIVGGSFFPLQELSNKLSSLSFLFPQALLLDNSYSTLTIDEIFYISVISCITLLAIRRLHIK
ncbi:ABC transporter permease [Bacillus sp. 31A1R]|uniref:ABC transporter permease n=1 Tax=Robertmurraya mangrovi TaxID=3098077 RepID=A0ABU5IXQ5_9BACI|nr:ABC transporter permease [Bacillus sp. 31A1R]MDZ5471938.1 ABC transporter permease [Bacillus sp. 31A1R]